MRTSPQQQRPAMTMGFAEALLPPTVGSLSQRQAWVTIPWVEHLATGTGTATRHSAPDNKVTAPVRQLSRTEDSITLKTTTVITPRPWQSV